MDLKCWQKGIDGNRNLLELNLVGTHDCVTKYVQFSHFSKCQNLTIYEQLNIGVRALDIRVIAKGNRLKMVHGVAKAFNQKNHFSPQMDMSDALQQCYRFLEENPSEALVFQFKNDNGKCQEQSFDNLYNTYIKNHSDMWYLSSRIPLLDEVRGKIVLLRRCNKSSADYPLGTGIDFSKWIEQDELVPTPLKLNTGYDNFIIQDRYKYKPYPRFKDVIAPFLNSMKPFENVYVINYLSTAGGLKGPEKNARYINSKFMEYELDKRLYYGIVYVDFPSDKLIEKVVQCNF